MKSSRNQPCPCGSGKKYKYCCLSNPLQQPVNVLDDFEHVIAMNPNITAEELSVLAQHRIHKRNNQPHKDFCGLTPTQIANWLYAPFNGLTWITFSTPKDLSSSPVMRYLTLILDEAMQNGGSINATRKGNLPVKLVKSASQLLPELALNKYPDSVDTREFFGSNEDKFNALHYTRILAELADIIELQGKRYQVKEAAQQQYQAHGVNAFYMNMLEAALYQYNWNYLDGWEIEIDLRPLWVFMLWRLQSHADFDQLLEDVVVAFPALMSEIPSDDFLTPTQLLGCLIDIRFIKRFLVYWGFIIQNSEFHFAGEPPPRVIEIQPLMQQTFQFDTKL